MQNITVIPVRVLADNYAFLVFTNDSKLGVIIDAAEPEKVLVEAKKHSVCIIAFLTTHHHHDHSGGNEWLHQNYPTLPILGGKGDDVPYVSLEVSDDDTFEIDSSTIIRIIQTPCHTKGHVIYHICSTIKTDVPGALFTGDTLFVGGCGRFFEGTAAQMLYATEKIAALPPDTLVYVGHEYTVSNLTFALCIEPQNTQVQKKLEWSRAQCSRGKPTIPSSVREELATNPFMRTSVKSVQAAVKCSTSLADVMASLRLKKNNFGLGARAGSLK